MCDEKIKKNITVIIVKEEQWYGFDIREIYKKKHYAKKSYLKLFEVKSQGTFLYHGKFKKVSLSKMMERIVTSEFKAI